MENLVRGIEDILGVFRILEFHRELGKIMWEHVGMARNRAGLQSAIKSVQALRAEFQKNVKLVGRAEDMNKALEYGMRVADYMEFAELMARDALDREESCGCHFREEYQTPDGECLRNDEKYSYVAAWEHTGTGKDPVLHKEDLAFEAAPVKQRSYK